MNTLSPREPIAPFSLSPWTSGRVLVLVNTLARFSLKAEASRLYLSYVWYLVEPILYVLVFYVVFDLFLDSGRENFLLFLLCGKVPFLWFARSVTLMSESIVSNRGLIEQMDIPKILFPLASLLEGVYRQWPVFLLLLLIAFAQGFLPSPAWLWLLPILLVQLLLIACCGLLAGVIVTYVPDMRILISLGMTFLLFTSGIFYDAGEVGGGPFAGSLLLIFNPLAFLITCSREVIMSGAGIDWVHLLLLGVCLAAVLVFLAFLYRLLDRHLAAEVLA